MLQLPLVLRWGIGNKYCSITHPGIYDILKTSPTSQVLRLMPNWSHNEKNYHVVLISKYHNLLLIYQVKITQKEKKFAFFFKGRYPLSSEWVYSDEYYAWGGTKEDREEKGNMNTRVNWHMW